MKQLHYGMAWLWSNKAVRLVLGEAALGTTTLELHLCSAVAAPIQEEWSLIKIESMLH